MLLIEMRLIGFERTGRVPRPQLPNMVHSGTFSVERSPGDVFAVLANPERFAPLMPDFESMIMQDATRFTLRTVIALGNMQGHANLAMELCEADPPSRVSYAGEATIAGGPLLLTITFALVPAGSLTHVSWQGEVSVGGPLALLAGSVLETMGRQNLEHMAKRIQENLTLPRQSPSESASTLPVPDASEYDI